MEKQQDTSSNIPVPLLDVTEPSLSNLRRQRFMYQADTRTVGLSQDTLGIPL